MPFSRSQPSVGVGSTRYPCGRIFRVPDSASTGQEGRLSDGLPRTPARRSLLLGGGGIARVPLSVSVSDRPLLGPFTEETYRLYRSRFGEILARPASDEDPSRLSSDAERAGGPAALGLDRFGVY